MAVKKITASSVAEVVVAAAIIAICFTVASLIFIRSTNSTLKFQNFKDQTSVQSQLMKMIVEQKVDLQNVSYQSKKADTDNDTLIVVEYMGNDNRIIWTQEWLKDK